MEVKSNLSLSSSAILILSTVTLFSLVIGFFSPLLAKDIKTYYDKTCLSISKEGYCRTKKFTFTAEDQSVCYLMKLQGVEEGHNVEFRWYKPGNSLYRRKEAEIEDPGRNRYFRYYRIWDCVDIAGTEAVHSPGQWTITFLVDGRRLSMQRFKLKSPPLNEPPATSGLSEEQQESDPGPKSEPSLSLQNIKEDTSLVYEENFDSYEGGTYKIVVERENRIKWHDVARGRQFNDFLLEVKAKKGSSVNKGGYGLLFRKKNGDDFYRFALATSGYYYLDKRVSGEWKTLIGLTRYSPIKQDQEWNLLQVIAKESSLKLYVNGHHLKTVDDPDLDTGNIAISASTSEQVPFEARFDRVSVYSIS